MNSPEEEETKSKGDNGGGEAAIGRLAMAGKAKKSVNGGWQKAENDGKSSDATQAVVSLNVTRFVDDEGEGDCVDRDLEAYTSAHKAELMTDMAMRDYVIVNGLGKGGFSAVMLVQRRGDKKLYALKVISKEMIREPKHRKRLQVERVILTKLPPSPFIARLTRAFQTDSELFFLMDYCAGGDLCYQCFRIFSKIERFNDGQARFYISQITLAIEHLHKHGFVHRDIKPEK